MKRKATDSQGSSEAKRQKEPVSEYCDVEPRKDDDGAPVWPASPKAIEDARAFLKKCAASQLKTLIVPDKDADGLDAGVIVHRTLRCLGASPDSMDVHLVKKGNSIHDEEEREAMKAKNPKYIIVVDQGSRAAPSVVESSDVKSLIIDHHLSDEFPNGAMVVSACHYPPVATSALLTYEICKNLHPDIASLCGYLCAMGTHGDLGNTVKWKPPFPDMTEVFKTHTRKAISTAVSLLNAPRRTATFDVITAWEALLAANSPKEVLNNPRLLSARAEVNEEVERQTHTAPKFSKDGKIAVFRIHSAAQVHPVIATRWATRLTSINQANHLKSPKLEIVLVANSGYLPNMVNFSCRIARCARNRDPPVNIIASLKAVAELDTTDLTQRMGESFARGHKEASGGIVPVKEFEELMALMKVGEKPDATEGNGKEKKGGKTVEKSPQKNTLSNYFGKKA
ncbi:MAG: hypothetical protein LQ350_002561 [Teloschistes chrysophthalmus]|nr:MAG: hypothetical protein LQ350_002561 [Niorma chrysophthalma]